MVLVVRFFDYVFAGGDMGKAEFFIKRDGGLIQGIDAEVELLEWLVGFGLVNKLN